MCQHPAAWGRGKLFPALPCTGTVGVPAAPGSQLLTQGKPSTAEAAQLNGTNDGEKSDTHEKRSSKWKQKLQSKNASKKKKKWGEAPPQQPGNSQACQLSLTPSDIKLSALFTHTATFPCRVLQMINLNVLTSSFISSNSFKCPKSQGGHPNRD